MCLSINVWSSVCLALCIRRLRNLMETASVPNWICPLSVIADKVHTPYANRWTPRTPAVAFVSLHSATVGSSICELLTFGEMSALLRVIILAVKWQFARAVCLYIPCSSLVISNTWLIHRSIYVADTECRRLHNNCSASASSTDLP